MHLVSVSYICKCTKAIRLVLALKLSQGCSLHSKGQEQNSIIMLQPPVCIASAASGMAKGEGKGDWEKLMQWDLSHEGCEESIPCRKQDAGVVYPRRKMQWYVEHQLETLMRLWWWEEAGEEALCIPPWWYTKPGLPFRTSGSSCMADYSINGEALAQGENRSGKTEQEQHNILGLIGWLLFSQNSLWFYVEQFVLLYLNLTTTIFGGPTVLLSPDNGLLMLPWQPCSSHRFFLLFNCAEAEEARNYSHLS